MFLQRRHQADTACVVFAPSETRPCRASGTTVDELVSNMDAIGMQTQSPERVEKVLVPRTQRWWRTQFRFFTLTQGIRCSLDTKQHFSLLIKRLQIVVADGPPLRQSRVDGIRKICPRLKIGREKAFKRACVQERRPASSASSMAKELHFAEVCPALDP